MVLIIADIIVRLCCCMDRLVDDVEVTALLECFGDVQPRVFAEDVETVIEDTEVLPSDDDTETGLFLFVASVIREKIYV